MRYAGKMLMVFMFCTFHLMGQNTYSYYQFGSFLDFYALGNCSPKLNSLGGCANTITDDPSSIQINPAAITKSKDINAFYYSASPIHSVNSTYSGFKKCNVGFSFTTNNIDFIPVHPNAEKLTLNYSIFLDSGFCIGVNANCIRSSSEDFIKPTCWGASLDIGMLYTHNFSSLSGKINSFSFGFSFDNPGRMSVYHPFEPTSIVITDHAQIPSFIGSGIAWKFSPPKYLFKNSLKIFSSNWQIGFDQHLNYAKETNYRSGLEITLLEIVSLRCGIVNGQRDNIYGNHVVFNYISDGFGLSLPLQKLTRIPFKLTLDYFGNPIWFETFMSTYEFYGPHYEEHNTFAIGLFYYPGMKKKKPIGSFES